MSIIQSGVITPASTGFYDYPIEQSLRFDGSSYLSRTPTTTGNQRIFTWSGWVKRSIISGNDNSAFFSAGAAGGSDGHILLSISAGDSFFVYGKSSSISGGLGYVSPSLYRDSSAWYHIVYVVDTTSSARIHVYVNENEISMPVASANLYSAFPASFSTLANTISQPQYISMVWNSGGTVKTGYFNGYLANIQFIDGQALNSHYFGEFKNGIWIPKAFDGTASDSNYTISGATSSYGTNGFRLAFDAADFNWSSSATMTDPYGSSTAVPIYGVADASGNGKHWVMNS